MADLIDGFETPYGMELLASVHWVATKGEPPARSAEAAVDAVLAWNERKRDALVASGTPPRVPVGRARPFVIYSPCTGPFAVFANSAEADVGAGSARQFWTKESGR